MGGFLVAWLVGLSLSIAQGASEWKYTTAAPHYFPLTFASPLPPKPGQILVASGIYAMLAILAEAPSMRSTATLIAWGYNIAIGLTWAQNYATEKKSTTANGQKLTGGTLFWTPPTAPSDKVYPTGAGPTSPASPSSTNSPTSNSTNGTVGA